ncbi:MAG: alkaline phosphatase [Planctomycetota bacterium]
MLRAFLFLHVTVGLATPIMVSSDEARVATGDVVNESAEPTKSIPDAVPDRDAMRVMQSQAIQGQSATWGRWGNRADKYSSWTSHTNRLVPVYTFGMSLSSWRDQGSPYRDADRIKQLYGRLPADSVDAHANYFDQSQVHDLMQTAVRQGKRHIIAFVFDGMDWQTTRAAAIYRSGVANYDSGRGTGLSFQDYRGAPTDFAFVVTSPASGGAKPNVNTQTIQATAKPNGGGFHPGKAGPMPWMESTQSAYPIGLDPKSPHAVTDSAASATSLFSGIKTYNGAINVDPNGDPVVPIARRLQDQGFRVGAVTSVPLSHATPASAYANNVSRKDYQDISRDMIGRPSSAHRREPLPGMDVVIGGGYGEGVGESSVQGDNFMPGNQYIHESDVDAAEENYVVASRTKGQSGRKILSAAAASAVATGKGLLGLFGGRGGHLPYRTADGDYEPTFDVRGAEKYSQADLNENPTLAEMTAAALTVLSAPSNSEPPPARFWLLVEAGDVDWANHSNNIDNSIGAVHCGADAFDVVTQWVERHDAWDDTLVVVTSDHGHYLVLTDVDEIAAAGKANRAASSAEESKTDRKPQ